MEEKATGTVGLVQTRIATIALPPGGFRLESGAALPELHIAYETYGELADGRNNAVFICDTLTSDAHAAGRHDPADRKPGWWDSMIGPGKGIDTNYYFVVCSNILGGCKGTTGPSSVNPLTGKPYGTAFPHVTIGDMVEAQRLLLEHLDVRHLAAVVGGSLGGMQALEWSIRFPAIVDRCVCIAAGANLSAQALAFNVVGRGAITSDPQWSGGDYYDRGEGRGPAAGLAQARKIGHITYLSKEMMSEKFGREKRPITDRSDPAPADAFRSRFQVESYLDYQGRTFVDRFDANSYLYITRAVDEYDLEEKHGSLEKAFASIKAKFLVVTLSADWLFPPEQSEQLATALLRAGRNVSCCRLNAPHGHDAFLIENEDLARVVRAFLPWITTGGGPPLCLTEERDRREFDFICGMIRDGSRVLDLGCGNGSLLTRLQREKGATGLGVDIDIRNVIEVINRGHDALQGDLDTGLGVMPDGTYDYAILSETLQVVGKPREILREMLRVAREGIVTFPNFAKWSHRLRLGLCGRMPKSAALPYEWYNTPNIHHTTLRDFADLCREENIRVLETVCLPGSGFEKLLLRFGMRNLGAERVLVRLTREA